MKKIETPSPQSVPTLSVDKVSKRYRKNVALDEISFEVPAASLTVILGSAGAGKTTTLRLVAGLENPDNGDLMIGGEDVGPLEPKDRDVAMIFDNLALYPNKTGFENIASPLVIKGEEEAVIEERVAEVAATLKISHILNRLPKTMSGGERQRIALGRALIRSPKLFLLDEPLSSLDAKLRIELRAELRRLQKELGYTFLMATPDFQEALSIADTVIMLSNGKIVQVSSPQELYDHPVNTEVATFVGAPIINLIEAEVLPENEHQLINSYGGTFSAPEKLGRIKAFNNTKLILGIRPENLILQTRERSDFSGTIKDIEPLGLNSVLTIENEDIPLRLLVLSSELRTLSIGDCIGVSIRDYESLLFFDPESGQNLLYEA